MRRELRSAAVSANTTFIPRLDPASAAPSSSAGGADTHSGCFPSSASYAASASAASAKTMCAKVWVGFGDLSETRVTVP